MPTKKLIEVALPLPEINDASAYDKMPGIGPHPKGIHHWWARLPLPTARAILFSSVIDDPSEHPDKFPSEEAQDAERERLFGIIREMMGKQLHAHPEIYAKARVEMEKSCGGKLPAVLDPFSGGGSIPLEANRLGFDAHAADLNPVAVLLNKCNLELAPRWVGNAPVNPHDRGNIGGTQSWQGTTGLAADVRYYGNLVRERAIVRIGKYYPKVSLTLEQGGADAEVVAWIWARTVASPNPTAQGKHVPLMGTFWLSSKGGKQTWLVPLLDSTAPNGWRFEIHTGTPDKEISAVAKLGTRAGKAQAFNCILTNTPISRPYIQAEGKAGRLKQRLVAICFQRRGGKGYTAADATHTAMATELLESHEVSEARTTFLSGELPDRASITGGVCSAYGLSTWGHLFTNRQIKGLLTLSDQIQAIYGEIDADAKTSGLNDEAASAYATSVMTFLALAADRCSDFNNSLCRWSPSNQKVMNMFGKQALPMVWDFAEANLIGEAVGAWKTCCEYVADCVEVLCAGGTRVGSARQADAADGAASTVDLLVSTDPPYYDNIGYATLSDFFYVWLRRTVGSSFHDIFGTVLVPKMPELTASPGRFGGDAQKAKEHFETGFRKTFTSLQSRLSHNFPLTVYYAFKQEDEADEVVVEQSEEAVAVDLTTGWETLLEALISSGFQITATWPVRASQAWRMVSMGTNALASYIVLACRPRANTAPQIGRRDFLAELKRELPAALRHLQQGNVAPVDFAQACIGPGMAVYSRYSRILESDGRPLTVRTALSLINQIKEEVLGEPESDYDPETRWALIWFDQNGFSAGDFGAANTLANAHAIAVSGLQDAGIVAARSGVVRLLRPDELPKDWNPGTDQRLTVWEMTHHLMRLYHVEKAGDAATASLLRQMGSRSDAARDLAYRLFSVAERRKRSADALGYNALVLGWPELTRLAQEVQAPKRSTQGELI